MLKKQNESTHLVIPTSDMMRFREKIGAKISGLLAKTTHNYAEMKQIVIADLVSFNKKRDREVSGVTRKEMILQRSLALQRAQTTDYELFELTEVEMMFAKYYTLLRLPGKGGKFVPVLIPPKTLEVIDIMIDDDKLKSDNYFFQTEGGEQFYRSIDVLRKYAEEFKLQDKKSVPIYKAPQVSCRCSPVLGFTTKPKSLGGGLPGTRPECSRQVLQDAH